MPSSFKTVFLFIVAVAATSAHGAASVEYACGTVWPGGGGYYTDIAQVRCEDETGKVQKNLSSDGKEVFCMYQAVCTPLTTDIKKALLATAKTLVDQKLITAPKDRPLDWSDLSDDQINQSVGAYYREYDAQRASGKPLMPYEQNMVSVSCLGTKDGEKPVCPKVNDCLNPDRPGSTHWKVRSLQVKPSQGPLDSVGFGMQKNGTNVPRAVTR